MAKSANPRGRASTEPTGSHPTGRRAMTHRLPWYGRTKRLRLQPRSMPDVLEIQPYQLDDGGKTADVPMVSVTGDRVELYLTLRDARALATWLTVKADVADGTIGSR